MFSLLQFLLPWASKKYPPSIWKHVKEAQLHKHSSKVFRGFWNINKRACRYILQQEQLWQRRENVFESYYKSHNTATNTAHPGLACPPGNMTAKSCLYRWRLEKICGRLCVRMVCVWMCNVVLMIKKYRNHEMGLELSCFHMSIQVCMRAHKYRVDWWLEKKKKKDVFSWLKPITAILFPFAWKEENLQILCFPFMGNFTSSSWGLVQMKTNGEPDSSQVSGNCRSEGKRDD